MRARTGSRALRIFGSVIFALLLNGCEALNPIASHNQLPTQGQVESSLTCQCGCGLTVHSCNHLSCSSGEPLKLEIAGQISEGLPLPEILSHFENKYGEIILSSPTARGFNLAAWTVPFIMLGFGTLGVAYILWRWRRNDRGSAPKGDAAAKTDPELRARLEDELKKFDDRN
jgi:cytochrome c-type biogenesis protein CcmH